MTSQTWEAARAARAHARATDLVIQARRDLHRRREAEAEAAAALAEFEAGAAARAAALAPLAPAVPA